MMFQRPYGLRDLTFKQALLRRLSRLLSKSALDG